MPVTYDPIATTTLGTATNTITFSSIPGTYTDLRIVLVGVAATSSEPSIVVRYNSDTAGNYSTALGYADGSTFVTASDTTNNTYIYWDYAGGLTNTQPTLWTMDIFSYTGSTFKTCLFTGTVNLNSSSANTNWIILGNGMWRSTSAITSINISSLGGPNYAVGTTATLYGIKAA